MYPRMAEELLFVEEDGYFFVALPGKDVQKLSRPATALCRMCTGATALEEVVRQYAEAFQLSLSAALSEAWELLQTLVDEQYVQVYAEPLASDLEVWRLEHHLSAEGEVMEQRR